MTYRVRIVDSEEDKTNYAIIFDGYDSTDFNDVWNYTYYLTTSEVVYAINLYLQCYGISINGSTSKIYKAFNNMTDDDLNNIIDSEKIQRDLKEYCLDNALKEYKRKKRR